MVQGGEGVPGGQHAVQDDTVVVVQVEQEVRLRPVVGTVDRVAGGLEAGRHDLAEVGFVLDQEYAHVQSALVRAEREDIVNKPWPLLYPPARPAVAPGNGRRTGPAGRGGAGGPRRGTPGPEPVPRIRPRRAPARGPAS